VHDGGAPDGDAPQRARIPVGRTLIASLAGLAVAIGVAYLHHLGGKAAAVGFPGAAGTAPGAAAAPPTPTPAVGTPSAGSLSAAEATPSATVTQAPYKHVLYAGSGAPGVAGGYTAVFTTGSDWSISYTYDCSNMGRPGEFMVFEEGGPRNGAMPVMVLGRTGAAVYFEHGDAGRRYLAIESLCSWTIRVADAG